MFFSQAVPLKDAILIAARSWKVGGGLSRHIESELGGKDLAFFWDSRQTRGESGGNLSGAAVHNFASFAT